jgi:hypothetical protein
MRGARHVELSAAILNINSQISLVTGLLPTGVRTREISRHRFSEIIAKPLPPWTSSQFRPLSFAKTLNGGNFTN